jgi:hypothetical protein
MGLDAGERNVGREPARRNPSVRFRRRGTVDAQAPLRPSIHPTEPTRRGYMRRIGTLAAIPVALLLAAAACDNAGEHNDPSSQGEKAEGADPVTRQDSATVGQQINAAYPPVGSTSPTPPDSNPAPSTPGGNPPTTQTP